MNNTLVCAALAFALSLAAHAAGAQDGEPRWYGGLSLGQSKVSIDNSDLQVAGATASTISKDETDTAYKLFAGYRFNRNFAVEGGWTDLGKFKATNTVTAPAAGSASISVKSSGPHAEAVGILPVNNFSFFGKAGLMYTMTKSSGSSSGAVVFTGNPNQEHSELNLKIGFGAGYDITRNVGVRVEYEHIFDVGDKDKTGEGDVRVISLGVLFRF